MKASRHACIKDIVENQAVETQEELAEALRRRGIDVTQATVSRDIKELMLIKIPTGEGRYRYAFPPENNVVFSQARLARVFQDSVAGMDASLNIVVIRTVPGLAQAVAYAVDASKWPEIIGTVGGDDTVFVVVKPPEAAEKVLARFRALM